MDLSGILRQVFTIWIIIYTVWITKILGEIRCYCNEPACVSTGYMCKSQSGQCYSKLKRHANIVMSVHGCVEFLPKDEQCPEDGAAKSSRLSDISSSRSHTGTWPSLSCCKDDMCNYIDSLNINVNTDTTSNMSVLKKDKNRVHHQKSKGSTSGSRSDVMTYGSDNLSQLMIDGATNFEGPTSQYRYEHKLTQREIWFKAAVIAVPIAGGFILVLLVLLAVRMLRNDGRREQSRTHHSLAKAQLFVAGHFNNNKNAAKNSPHRTFQGCTNKTYHLPVTGIVFDGKHPYEKLTAACDSPSHTVIVPPATTSSVQSESVRNSVVVVNLPDPSRDSSIV